MKQGTCWLRKKTKSQLIDDLDFHVTDIQKTSACMSMSNVLTNAKKL